MTCQISDGFRFRGRDCSAAGTSSGSLFDPAELGLRPASSCTACWRGYQAVFAVSNSRLVLDELHVSLLDDDENAQHRDAPVIGNGVRPTSGQGSFFQHRYQGLNHLLRYSGGLLIATDFIENLYRHGGIQPPWRHQTVLTLIFEDGVLTSESVISERMAKLQRALAELEVDGTSDEEPDLDEVLALIERSFDLSYGFGGVI